MSLKGVVLNFNLYNPNFKNYYFYITTIFEINSGIIYSYRQNVEIYQVDAYYNMTSKEYLYDFILLDIFRFSITIALGLIFLRDWGDTIYKRYKKISDENLLFNGRILHDGVIIVFFLYRYSVKLYYSYIKIDYENMVTFQDVSFDGNSYYTKQNYFGDGITINLLYYLASIVLQNETKFGPD